MHVPMFWRILYVIVYIYIYIKEPGAKKYTALAASFLFNNFQDLLVHIYIHRYSHRYYKFLQTLHDDIEF